MADIWTGWNTDTGYGDWAISPAGTSLWLDESGVPIIDDLGQPIDAVSDLAAGFSNTGDLVTAVLISLFTDAAASNDDVIPDGTVDRRGWWGGGIGSKLWLRMRSKATPLVLAQVKDDIQQALAWLITDGVASAVDVVTEFTRPGMLGAQVTISRNNAPDFALRFSRLWDQIGAGPSGSPAVAAAAPVAPMLPSIGGMPNVAIQGTAYMFTPTTAGGAAPYSFTITGTLPAGLSFAPDTGSVSGMPTATGAGTISITLTDAAGQSATLGPFTLTVAANAAVPVALYDQGMGATNAAGYVASFPLQRTVSTGAHAGIYAQQIWVDTALGSSSYNGLSPYPGYQMNGTGPNFQWDATGRGTANSAYGPKADAVTAILLPQRQTFVGNQYFFAEGQTFPLAGAVWWCWLNSTNATYPTCYQSYDNTDPLNTGKHGMAGIGSRPARPKWTLGTGGGWPGNSRGDQVEYGGMVMRGIEFDGNGPDQFVQFLFSMSNMLIENMVFNEVQLTIQNNNSYPGWRTSSNVIVRRSAFYGAYTVISGRPQGTYLALNNFTLEDNVFWHCGWKIGDLRSAAANEAPSIYNHCAYIHGGYGTWGVERRNVMIDASAAGFSNRGNHISHHNVIIDCPTPDYKGVSSNSTIESPSGVTQQTYCQLVLGGADITPSLPRMEGFSTYAGGPDSFYVKSLYAQNPGYGQGNNSWLSVANFVGTQETFTALQDNAAYYFAPLTKTLLTSKPGTLPFQVMIPLNDNVVNYGATSPIGYTSTADGFSPSIGPVYYQPILTALGFANKAAFVAAMIADPSIDWAYQLLTAAGAAFDFDFNHSIDSYQAFHLNLMTPPNVPFNVMGVNTTSISVPIPPGATSLRILNYTSTPCYVAFGPVATTSDILLGPNAYMPFAGSALAGFTEFSAICASGSTTIDNTFGTSAMTVGPTSTLSEIVDPYNSDELPVHNNGSATAYGRMTGTTAATTSDTPIPPGATVVFTWTSNQNNFAAITGGGVTHLSFPPLLASPQFTGNAVVSGNGCPQGGVIKPALTYTASGSVTVTEYFGNSAVTTAPSFDYLPDASGTCLGLWLTANNMAQLIGTDFSNTWQNATQGTILYQGDCPATGTIVLEQVDDGTQNNRITLQVVNGALSWIVVVGGTVQCTLAAGTITAGVPFMTGLSFAANAFATATNGVAGSTDSSGAVPTGLIQRTYKNNGGHLKMTSFLPVAQSPAWLQGATVGI